MKKVYIIRHGQTDTNELDVVSGENGVLSEKGIREAQSLARRFEEIDFSHIFTSDFKRAKETSIFIAEKTKKDLLEEPLLRELTRPIEFLGKSRTSPEYLAFLDDLDSNINNPDWHFSNEENFFDLIKRVSELFAKLEKMKGDVVLVTHARMVMTMTMYVMMGKQLTPDVWKIGMRNMTVSNTGITTIAYNEEIKHWKLEMFNDRAHFAE